MQISGIITGEDAFVETQLGLKQASHHQMKTQDGSEDL